MRNHEVTTKHALLDEHGQLMEPGWSRQLIQEYRREAIKAPKFRIKEWDYYFVMGKDFGVALTISDLGYMGMISASYLDFTKPWEHTESVLIGMPMGKLKLPSDTSSGVTEFQNERLKMCFEVKDGERHLTCDFKKFDGDKDFSCDICLVQPQMDTLVIATPWDKKHHFYYNQKINCMPASGWIDYAGECRDFDETTDFGILDWGRGVWTYDNYWYWGSGSGYVDGKPVGFNIGYGFGNTKAATENVIFYDGVAHKIDEVTFNIPKEDFLKPWTFSSSDGRFEMDFVPIIDRNSLSDYKLIVSDQHQVFGKMSGTMILDDGTKVQLKDFICFAEKVHNKY